MKRYLLALPLVLTLLGIAFAQGDATAVSIPILNPTFDGDGLSCGAGAGCYENGATGWLCGPNSGVAKFSTLQYPAAPPSGIFVAAIGDSSVTGSIFQTLGANIEANTTYILTLSVGARADYPFTGYQAVLLAGNVPLASRNAATPVGGTFVTDAVVYESGANPPQSGQPLQILVRSMGTGQVNIAAVSLTATPVTENKQ
jgi:hypothetical protein